MRYHNITKDDMRNGDGIRAVLWVSGCTHKCPECHNPVTWNENGGLEFDAKAKEELFRELEKSYVAGVTFSGGDPLAMYNREDVLNLMAEIKEKFPDKTVWVYTGWTKEEMQEDFKFWNRLTSLVDVIVEGRFVKELKDVNYQWAGSTNQRVLRKESNFEINTSEISNTHEHKCSGSVYKTNREGEIHEPQGSGIELDSFVSRINPNIVSPESCGCGNASIENEIEREE